jgi:putative DNA primase/helicase
LELPANFLYNNAFFRYGDKLSKWAVGHEWVFKGNAYRIVHYGDWRTGDTNTHKSYEETKVSPAFKKREQEALQEIKLTMDVELSKKNEECARKWSLEILSLQAGDLHPYLENKSISSNHGAKTSERGALIIPVRGETGVVGVQMIFKPENEWIKRFSTGIKKKGSFAVVGEPAGDVAYICEGFATACTIHEASLLQVYVALDAGNLFPAIQTIRRLHPKLKLIICADSDKNRVGITKALYCKKFFSNVIVREPKFTLKSDSQTDFNDLHMAEGIDAVRLQVAFTMNDFVHIKYLGHNGTEFFYTSTENKSIISLTASAHTKLNFFSLAPIDYWLANYSNEEGKISYDNVAADLIKKSLAVGNFNPETIRGRGVWIERGVATLNTGDENIPEIKDSKFHYQRTQTLNVTLTDKMDDEESLDLLAAFNSINFKDSKDHAYVAAWLVQAMIFAAIPWRFHLWLTGEAGSGKTTVLDWIEKLLVLSLRTENATASGIVQSIHNDACPVIYDETEAVTGRMKAVIEIARQSSSASSGKHIRGSANGQSVVNNTKSVFLFASIQTEKMETADLSRFFFVEMVSKQSRGEYNALRKSFEAFYNRRDALFARVFGAVPSINSSIEIARNVFGELNFQPRQVDQLASMVACYWALVSIEPINEEQVHGLIGELALADSEYMEQNQEKDDQRCLKDLLAVEVDNFSNNIGQLIEDLRQHAAGHFQAAPDPKLLEKYLATFGIRFYPESNSILIASGCDKLRGKMKNYPSYIEILRRSPMCVESSAQQRIRDYDTKASRGIRVTLT